MNQKDEKSIILKYKCKICGKQLASISKDSSAIIIHAHFTTPEGIYCTECWDFHKLDYFKKHRKSKKTKEEVNKMGKGKNKGTKETKKPKGGKKEK